MSQTILLEAIYEKGVIKPLEEVDLPENAHLRVKLKILSSQPVSLRGLWKSFGDLDEKDFKAAKRLWEHGREKQLKLVKGTRK